MSAEIVVENGSGRQQAMRFKKAQRDLYLLISRRRLRRHLHYVPAYDSLNALKIAKLEPRNAKLKGMSIAETKSRRASFTT